MQLKKLTDDHYVVVTDEPITKGNWYISPSGGIISDHNGTELLPDGWKKITHSTEPLDVKITDDGIHLPDWSRVKPLSPRVVKSLVGEVDVEKKADEFADSEYVNNSYKLSEAYPSVITECYTKGYNQCLEDNKDKKYTEEDMRRAFEKGFEFGEEDYEIKNSHDDLEYNKDIMFNEIISSLTQPKDTWEVYFDENNNLKLK